MGEKFLKECDELLDDNLKFENERFYSLKEILINQFTGKNDKLIVPIGKQDNGEYIYMNLEEVPGLFVSGTTGTGKSLFLDCLIVTLMLKNSPDEVNFLMIDPKKVELGEYDGISYININNRYKKYSISSKEKGLKALKYVLEVINKRADFLVEKKCKSIKSYNSKNEKKLPHIFIFIDEASDIIEMKEAEEVLSKILNVGRVLGIHLILATNSYLKKMFSNRFISRFKYRMSFDLTDEIQSVFVEIKDTDKLRTEGDSIIRCQGDTKLRFQAPYIQDDEIKRVSDKKGGRKNIEV